MNRFKDNVLCCGIFMSLIFCCVRSGIAATQFSMKAIEQGLAEESSLMKIQEYLSRVRDDKTNLTPARQKLSTDLLQLIDRRFLPASTKIERVADNMQSLKQLTLNNTENRVDQKISEGSVYVYIYFHLANPYYTFRP